MGSVASRGNERYEAGLDQDGNGEEDTEKSIYKQFVERKKYGVVDIIVNSSSTRRAGML